MPRAPAALVTRLQTLTGSDGACCVTDLRAKATAIRSASSFQRALLRSRALGDEARLLAATMIQREGQLCGCELQAALGLTHATVSHHMAALVEAGIIVSERRGKWIHYRLAPGAEAWLPTPIEGGESTDGML